MILEEILKQVGLEFGVSDKNIEEAARVTRTRQPGMLDREIPEDMVPSIRAIFMTMLREADVDQCRQNVKHLNSLQ